MMSLLNFFDIMNPGSPLLSLIDNYGQEIYKSTREHMECHL